MKHFYISSQQSCFVKKGVLENFTNILEKNLLWILFLIKACNFIKSRLQRRCFPLKCTKFFRTYPCDCFYTQIKFLRMPVILKKKNVKANDFGCRCRPCFKLYKLLVDYSYANVKCRGLFSNLFMDNNKVNDIITGGSVYQKNVRLLMEYRSFLSLHSFPIPFFGFHSQVDFWYPWCEICFVQLLSQIQKMRNQKRLV